MERCEGLAGVFVCVRRDDSFFDFSDFEMVLMDVWRLWWRCCAGMPLRKPPWAGQEGCLPTCM